MTQVLWTAVEMQHRVVAVDAAIAQMFERGAVAQIGDNSVAFTYFCRGRERDVTRQLRVVESYPAIARCLLMNFFHTPIASKYRM
jgi:hypothetical protein